MAASLRIGIDAHLIRYRRGIGNYVYNLVRSLAELPAPHQYILYVADEASRAEAPDDPRFSVRVLGPKLLPLWEQIALPRAAAQDRLNLLHCTANTAPLILPAGLPLLLTIHDVIFLLPHSINLPASPSLYQRLGRVYYRCMTRRASQRAAAVTTVSEFSRADIVRHLHLSPKRVKVVRNAPNGRCRRFTSPEEGREALQRLGVRSPFILALGAVDPRKNTQRVLEAFAGMRPPSEQTPPQLVLCGVPTAHQARLRRQTAELGIADRTVIADFVTNEEMVALYNACELFVFPSLYEGFGIPLVEAMACGAPILTSPITALPEVAGDAAHYVDPARVERIRAGMEQLLLDAERREEMRAAGLERAAHFSWRVSAEQLLHLYEETASAQVLQAPLAETVGMR